jgi:hypothetical protein
VIAFVKNVAVQQLSTERLVCAIFCRKLVTISSGALYRVALRGGDWIKKKPASPMKSAGFEVF